jgi:hypothetical protein
MNSTRPTFEEYRALSAEERELVRLDQALAFAKGEVEATVVKRARLKAVPDRQLGSVRRRSQASGERSS